MGLEQDMLNSYEIQARELRPIVESLNTDLYEFFGIEEFEFLNKDNIYTLTDAYAKKYFSAGTPEAINNVEFAYTVLTNPILKVLHDHTLFTYRTKNFKPSNNYQSAQ